MNNSAQNQIIQTLLDCGSADVEFLVKELENWHIAFSDAWESTNETWEKPTFNNLIQTIYQMAVDNSGIDQTEDDETESKITIFTNSIDSHLYVNDVEVYSFDELKKLVPSEEETELTNNQNA